MPNYDEVALIHAIQAWQANKNVHPLTCAADSSHPLLVPRQINPEYGGVELSCPLYGCHHDQPVTEALAAIILDSVKTKPIDIGSFRPDEHGWRLP